MKDECNGMPVKFAGTRGMGGGFAYELVITDFEWDGKLAIDLTLRHKDGTFLELPTQYLEWVPKCMSRLLHDLHTGSGQCGFDEEALKLARKNGMAVVNG